MNALYARLAALIDRSKEKGELKKDVPSAILARNLFAIFFHHLQIWLGGRNPQHALNHPRLRDSLELQFRGLRSSSLSPGSRSSVKASRRGRA